MPRCRDLVIFVDRRQTTDDDNDCFTPRACARCRSIPYTVINKRGNIQIISDYSKMTVQYLAIWMLMNAIFVLCSKTIASIPIFSMEGICPSETIREDLRSTLRQEVRTQLQNFIQDQLQDEGMIASL